MSLKTELFIVERAEKPGHFNARYYGPRDKKRLRAQRDASFKTEDAGDINAKFTAHNGRMAEWVDGLFDDSAVGKFLADHPHLVKQRSPYYRENEYGEIAAVRLSLQKGPDLRKFETEFAEHLAAGDEVHNDAFGSNYD